MYRSRKNRKSSLSRAIPLVHNGLNTVGLTAKGIAYKSKPILEKGVSSVYKTIATGFDLGLKGTKSVAKGVKSFTQKRRRHRRRKSSRRH